MKRLVSILLAFVIMFTAAGALADYVKVALYSDLNVRQEASYDSKVIGHLFRNEEVKVTKRLSDGWTKIKYNGKEAYVRSSYLSKTKLSGGNGKTAFPTLRYGAKSGVVKMMQRNLNKIMGTDIAPNGKFDTDTKKLVIKFQKKYGLTQDGVVGKKTWAKIIEYR